MEKSLLREEDIRLSNNVSDILDKELYPVYTTNVERIYDKERQVQGLDIVFDYNDVHYECDEKSAVRYRNLSTFSLELSFINRKGEEQEGWLTNPKYKNNSFMLIWLDNNIIECALVRKQAIYDYLTSVGWTVEKLRKKAEHIRYFDDNNFGGFEENNCKFTFSTHLYEKPINILLKRTTYRKLADKVWKLQVQ